MPGGPETEPRILNLQKGVRRNASLRSIVLKSKVWEKTSGAAAFIKSRSDFILTPGSYLP
jgi:hypothetical protein